MNRFSVAALPVFAGVAVLACVASVGTYTWLTYRDATRPPPLEFTSFYVKNAPPALVAGTVRYNVPECTNGLQAEIRGADGIALRLPVPAREIEGDVSRYPLVFPDGTPKGMYDMRVQESFLCGGNSVVLVKTPWLPLEIK